MVGLRRLLASSAVLLLLLSCSDDSCDEGEVTCADACVDLRAHASHCGACGVACDAGESCVEGRCEQACDDGLRACSGECVDLLEDPANCGSCGNECGSGVCVEGSCAEGCTEGKRLCGGECVDIARDPSNCGACGVACGDDAVCAEGACSGCAEGQQVCDGACVDVFADASHCGECGNECGDDQTCVDGACTCAGSFHACGLDCVDLQSDDEHCGDCESACTGGPNASGSKCEEGSCTQYCDDGYADCNLDAADGCEAHVVSDVENCGQCGLSCNELTGVDEVKGCVERECRFTCLDGWGDCDGNPATGCEAEFASDADNCGGCGQSCWVDNAGSASCDGGECSFVCADGFGDCDDFEANGCEVDLRDTFEHCGACNRSCELGEFCVDGLCYNPELPTWPLPEPGDADRFSVDGDTVVDSLTGLVWDRPGAPTRLSWKEAEDYCKVHGSAGEGWRLPTRIELATLVDWGRSEPAAYESLFPTEFGEMIDRYWTSSNLRADGANYWWVDFATGWMSIDIDRTEYWVRCVRGGKPQTGPYHRVDGDVVIAEHTGLAWQKGVAPGSYDRAGAESYCASLSLGGESGWRVPTLFELLSIADTRFYPMIDEEIFGASPGYWYWTSSPFAGEKDVYWVYGSEQSETQRNDWVEMDGMLRCVRSLE